jgi:hypothetical protein
MNEWDFSVRVLERWARSKIKVGNTGNDQQQIQKVRRVTAKVISPATKKKPCLIFFIFVFYILLFLSFLFFSTSF